MFIKLVRKINGNFFKSRGPRVSRNGKKVFESPPNVDDGLATKVEFKARSDTQIPARLAFPWKVGNKFTVFVICTFKFAIPMFVCCR